MATDLTNALARQGLYALLRQRLQRVIPIASPAAGSDWTITVPAGVTWEVLIARASFGSSAVVATRIPELRFTDPDGVQIARMPPVATVAASANVNTMWGNLVGTTVNSGGVAMQALPGDVVLGAGSVVRSSTFNIDVGDQWSLIVITVREWSPQQIAAQAVWLGRQLPGYDIIDEGAE